MRFKDFLACLEKAGWYPIGDAQHANIKETWRILFPVVAELEAELGDCEEAVRRYNDDCAGGACPIK